MALINDLVSYIVGARYEDLPQQVAEVTKRNILDTLATTIAGSSAPGLEELVGLVKGWGGREECTIVAYGGKVPAPNAALVNCTMGRARDFGPHQPVVPVHPLETLVPSMLVISEYSKMFKDRAINGRDFILASAIGSDLIYRLRAAGGKAACGGGWADQTFHPIPVAAMGAKLLGFDETKMLSAMGIAYALTSGNIQAHHEGTLAIRLQQGFSGKAGILAIVLADHGLSGAKDILEGKYGFYAVYMRGEFTPEALTAELGKRFEGCKLCTKIYPCCGGTHGVIDGALELAKEHKLKADNIEKATVYTNSYHYDICGDRETKLAPQTVPEAQFSYYYTVATALVKGKVFIDDFTEEAIRNPEVLAMARRVNVVIDPEKDKLQAVVGPTDIEIETKDGKHYKKTVEFFRGHPENPVTWDEVVQKLKDCARFAAKPLPSQNIDKISRMVGDLDKLDDVTTILEYLG